jgi:hypothetical protein
VGLGPHWPVVTVSFEELPALPHRVVHQEVLALCLKALALIFFRKHSRGFALDEVAAFLEVVVVETVTYC